MTEGTFEAVSVIAKVRLPRFFSYQFFKNANIGVNTAASIQPNPFWFWEKYLYNCIRTCFCNHLLIRLFLDGSLNGDGRGPGERPQSHKAPQAFKTITTERTQIKES